MAKLISHPYTRLGWTAILVILATRFAVVMIWMLLPQLSAAQTYSLILGDLILLIWQVRYGAKIAREINGFPLTWIIWAVILAVAAATLSNAGDKVANLHKRPQQAKIAPPIFEVFDGVAQYSGEIDFDAFEALQNTLTSDHDVKALQLSSNGGRIGAARGMARLVMEHGLETRASGTCASACVLVFIAGSPRILAPQGRLGFHGYELLSGIVTLDTQEEQARDTATYRSRGVDLAFLERAFAVPHDEMWFPTRADLRDAGVLTKN